jgi:hypothetical protein
MSLVFGGDLEAFPRGFAAEGGAARRISPARAMLSGARALLGRRTRLSFNRERAETLDAFARLASAVGLSGDERAIFLGWEAELSRTILALETLGAALELFACPDATLCWLREATSEEPFRGRSPLQMMIVDGRLGVEMTLLHLRARLRCRRLA